MKVVQIPVGNMQNFSYIIYDEKNNIGAIIDPSWDLEKIHTFLERNNISVKYIVNTHTHFDHVLGNEQMAEITKAKIIQHEKSTHRKDISVRDDEIISIGEINLRVLYTPGHSEDSICLILNKESVITGDTLFVGNCGRVDLPGNYGITPTSTILNEKLNNPMLNFKTKDAFLKYMVNDD